LYPKRLLLVILNLFLFYIYLYNRGGILVQEAEVSQIGFCAEGYEGVSCSVCANGYAKFGGKSLFILTFS